MSEDEKPVVLKEAESGKIKIAVERQKRLMFSCYNELFHIEKCVELERAHITYTVPDTLCGRLHQEEMWLSVEELLDLEDALDQLTRMENQDGVIVKEAKSGSIDVSISRDKYKLRTIASYTGYDERFVEVLCAHIRYSIDDSCKSISHTQNMSLNAEELTDIKKAIEQLGLREENLPT